MLGMRVVKRRLPTRRESNSAPKKLRSAFDDGREWLTHGPLRKTIPEDAKAMAYVAERAGHATEQAP
jgi:hypothetical protein